MEIQISYRREILTWMVISVEFVLLNILELILYLLFGQPDLKSGLVVWDFSYILAITLNPPLVQTRMVRSDQIVTRVLQTTLWMASFFFVIIKLLGHPLPGLIGTITSITALFFVLVSSRLLCRVVIKKIRKKGRNTSTVVFVGAGVNHSALYRCMTNDISTGYRVLGYFEDTPSEHFAGKIPLLGKIDDVTQWLEENKVDMLFCNLPSWRASQILEIIDYCENHLIHFYSVPNVRNYIRHRMQVEFMDDIPVLSLRYEPLRLPSARVAKRIFDVIFSAFTSVHLNPLTFA
jgi:FlaA1/EpsC-like NDP-sugar epimerase